MTDAPTSLAIEVNGQSHTTAATTLHDWVLAQGATPESLATALNSYIGYNRAADVVKKTLKEQKSIPQVVHEDKLLTEDQIKKVLDPTALTEPGLPGK